MSGRLLTSGPGLPFAALGVGLLLFLAAPILALLFGSSPAELFSALDDPRVGRALLLSLQSTLLSLGFVILAGTPLAWFFARTRRPWARVLETLVELPVVLPPAVLGIALLLAFGRQGLFGPALEALGVSLPFTPAAVVAAQVTVAAPFYVQSATAGFRKVDDDLLLVARSLGAGPHRAFLRIALPAALPGVVSGVALGWARALGEFGATLLFAGNLPGRTQTMPLAIYAALESDLSVARAVAVLLALAAFALLLTVRAAPRLFARRGRR